MEASATDRDGRAPAFGRGAAVAWTVAAVALLAALALWQRNGYWEYSDGVYALTARLLADGHGLYDEVAAAQPPPIYLAGALVLLVSDTLWALRAALAAVELATAALVVAATWRLTRSRPAAALAGLALPLAPWTLREHAQLIPETLAAPLLLGAALAASRAGRPRDGAATRAAVLAGALAAGAAACKLAFAPPALALVLLAAPGGAFRRRALAGFAAAGAALAAASLLVWGGALLDGAVAAQREAGVEPLSAIAGLWAQGAWNLAPLLACAALAWPLRARLADLALARALAVAALGGLLVFATLAKTGSYLTFIVVLEPPLVALGAAGLLAAWRERGRARAPLVAGLAAAAFAAAQVGSLLATPDDPALFTRPSAAAGPARHLAPDAVDAEVRRIRACPAGVATSAPPFLAFVAGRDVPGDQADQFILATGETLAPFRAAADADQPRCP